MNRLYDFIPDLHGQLHKLIPLLHTLGYHPVGSTWTHPEGRKVVFLGDYVDRGPSVREVLHLVRGMVDAGNALAIMGNHEFNLVCYYTPDGSGGWLRARTEKFTKQNAATRAAFDGREEELHDWLEWMKHLPAALDLGGARAVHACWDEECIRRLPVGCFTDPAFLAAASKKGTPEHAARETVLNGPEMPLPGGIPFIDKEGHSHQKARIRWWGRTASSSLGEVIMPRPEQGLLNVPLGAAASEVVNYPAILPPVFFGHYWMPADAEKKPVAPNLACLDFSAGLGGPLVAYRWDGETVLSPAKFVIAQPPAASLLSSDRIKATV